MKKKKLKEYLDIIEECRFHDPKKVLRLCSQMIAEGKETKDEKAKVYGEYYRLEAYYRMSRIDDKLLRKILLTMQLSHAICLYEIECKCCNMMAICLINQGDNVTALDYYEMGYEIAVRHRLSAMQRAIANNLGDMYLRLGEYKTAISYLRKSYERAVYLIEQDRQRGNGLSNRITMNIALLNISEIYFKMEDYEECLEHLNQIEKNPEENFLYYQASVGAVYACAYLKLDRKKQAAPYVEETIRAAEKKIEPVETAKDYEMLCNVLLDCDMQSEAERMLHAIGQIAKDVNMVNIWCGYYEIAIRLSKLRKEESKLLELYDTYMFYRNERDEFLRRQQLLAIRNKEKMNELLRKQEQMQKQNAALLGMSEHDPLTGLYNRYILNRICDVWCKEAIRKSEKLGLIILDVDFFKEFNDSYGHLAGDECLKKVSSCLLELAGKDELVARYGGDEFFVLLRNQSDDQVLEFAQTLLARVKEKKIVHKGSRSAAYVTVTMGLVNRTLQEGQSVFELIHMADTALYRAKEQNRGTICVYVADGQYKVW